MPEHTLEAYRLALEQGADALETDVVLTRDGVLVCRHDCELSVTTDVASHAEFASRKTIKRIDGETLEGWFVEDFTLGEIRALRARQRFDFRDRSFNGKFRIVTLAELLDLVATSKTKSGERPGLLVEIKHATYFDSIGMNMADAICDALRDQRIKQAPLRVAQASRLCPDPPIHSRDGCATNDSQPPIWVESFEIDILQRLRQRISTPIIQLLDAADMQPADVVAAGGSTTFGDLATPEGLSRIATYAVGIGAWKELIIPRVPARRDNEKPMLRAYAQPTSLVSDVHEAGFSVHAWTFRGERRFLATDDQDDPAREYQRFAALGLDGIITDSPDIAGASLVSITERLPIAKS